MISSLESGSHCMGIVKSFENVGLIFDDFVIIPFLLLCIKSTYAVIQVQNAKCSLHVSLASSRQLAASVRNV